MESIYYVLCRACRRCCKHCYEARFRPDVRGVMREERIAAQRAAE